MSKKNITPNDAYNLNLFTSKCCHAFNRYNGSSCVCSQCERIINQIGDNETLTISVKFNENTSSNVSGDLILGFRSKAKRFSTDPTLEICSEKCPKCNSRTRYARDPQDSIIFICSNPKCRHVFSKDD